MRFSDIDNDRFAWSWEASTDGGTTWKPLWELAYRRASGKQRLAGRAG